MATVSHTKLPLPSIVHLGSRPSWLNLARPYWLFGLYQPYIRHRLPLSRWCRSELFKLPCSLLSSVAFKKPHWLAHHIPLSAAPQAAQPCSPLPSALELLLPVATGATGAAVTTIAIAIAVIDPQPP